MRDGTEKRQACLLYDAENLGGGAPRAIEVVAAIQRVGFEVVWAAVTCQSHMLPVFAKVLPLEPFSLSGGAPSGKEREDILLAVASGYFLSHALSNRLPIDAVVLASEDKLLSMCLLPWLKNSVPAYILGSREFQVDPYLSNLGANKLVLQPLARKTPSTFNPIFLPIYDNYHFATVQPDLSGLRVLAVAVAREPVPKYIPFPTVSTEVTIGALAPQCDLPLEYWTDGAGTLYSPQAFFGVTTTGWYIRSAKGHRTGKRSIRINGRAIHAGTGNTILLSGDIIEFGEFRFEFVSTSRTAIGLITRMARDYELLAAIEQHLHTFIGSVLGGVSATWWDTLVPEHIRLKCAERAASEPDDEHPFRFTQFPDLQKIILAHWDLFHTGPINKLWHSKGQVRDSFDSMIRLRNRTMHPTRGGVTDIDRSFLERLHIAVQHLNPTQSSTDKSTT